MWTKKAASVNSVSKNIPLVVMVDWKIMLLHVKICKLEFQRTCLKEIEPVQANHNGCFYHPLRLNSGNSKCSKINVKIVLEKLYAIKL